jgi:hypothetical protein
MKIATARDDAIIAAAVRQVSKTFANFAARAGFQIEIERIISSVYG